jgi:hypothetical protein
MSGVSIREVVVERVAGFAVGTEYCQFLYKDRRRLVAFVQHATPDVLATKKGGSLSVGRSPLQKKKRVKQGDTQKQFFFKEMVLTVLVHMPSYVQALVTSPNRRR